MHNFLSLNSISYKFKASCKARSVCVRFPPLNFSDPKRRATSIEENALIKRRPKIGTATPKTGQNKLDSLVTFHCGPPLRGKCFGLEPWTGLNTVA